jgi:hypothetical protein
MSLIKDFNDLHFSWKGVLLTICSSIPIFFVSVYLFKNDLIARIEDNPWGDLRFYFVICLCVALSTLWFLANIVLSIHSAKHTQLKMQVLRERKMDISQKLISRLFGYKPKKGHGEESLKLTFMLTYAYATGYLGVCIFLNQQLFHFAFPNFLLASWGFILFRIFWVAIRKGILEEELENSFPKRTSTSVQKTVKPTTSQPQHEKLSE